MHAVETGERKVAADVAASRSRRRAASSGSFIEMEDGTRLFYRDWGAGPAIVFVHPWGLNSDIFEYQLVALSDQGVRCVAYDRRGHGRSDDPGHGYGLDSLATDLAAVMTQLDLRDATLVGYSMGAAEAVRYLSREGGERVSRLLLTSPLPPAGADPALTAAFVDALTTDRAACIAAGLPLFVGRNGLVSPALAQWVFDQFLRCSPKAAVECQRSNADSDYRADLNSVNLPTLIIQGDADEVCPLDASGRPLAAAIARGELRIYDGAPHGVVLTHRDRFTRDLVRFVQG